MIYIILTIITTILKGLEKYFHRRTIFFLLLTTVLICGCINDINKLQYKGAIHQLDYPSGSSSVFLDHHFYVMGDDASDILVLDGSLQSAKRLGIFPKGNNKRISKALKADIEASFIIKNDKHKSILFLGSGSLNEHRDSAFLFDPITEHITRLDYSNFYDQLRAKFGHLNIEGAANIADDFYLGIRANYSHPDNYIAIASGEVTALSLKRSILVKTSVKNIGLSGMDYDEQLDILFITFSTEDTSNSVADGKIGDSYIALVYNAISAVKKQKLVLNELINLTHLNDIFRGQKIESVSFNPDHSELLLVSDDDKGNTKLFKLAVNL